MNENIFLETFKMHISPSDMLILAVSGGVDSMVLFDFVKNAHPKEKIVVAHFDHSLR
jgi:tRNA(Ile)-lysidine synthase TilS/MesJ